MAIFNTDIRITDHVKCDHNYKHVTAFKKY